MATPTDQDREKARTLVRGYLGKSREVNEVVEANVAQALVDERERNQETRLKYCPTHRTIVPAFKDHRLSCCVLADEREAAYRAGQESMSVKGHVPGKHVLAISTRRVKDEPPPSEGGKT